MTDKLREEFEVWFDSKHKTENESLNFAIREAMFDAWKASRAALCVELPDFEMDCSECHYHARNIQAVLDDAGVRYK